MQTGIAVDPHTAESGALRVLPGSHRLAFSRKIFRSACVELIRWR